MVFELKIIVNGKMETKGKQKGEEEGEGKRNGGNSMKT